MPISICVYCGSRNGSKPAYGKAADEFGRGLGLRGWRLIYGAGDLGLMGKVSQAAQEAGVRSTGVIPEHLVKVEGIQVDLDGLIVTETMHERKKVMAMNADALVVLPGGAGSLDEFFEILTWAQLGLHAKPIVLVNVAGYWDPLLALIGHVCAEGFADESLIDLYNVVETPQEAFELLEKALT